MHRILEPSRLWITPILAGILCCSLLVAAPTPTLAQEAAATPTTPEEGPREEAADKEVAEEPATPEGNKAAIEALTADADHLWTIVAAILVFWMQAGFALVEAGFTRAKNAGNIMMKNAADMSIGALGFWLVGFGLMFGSCPDWTHGLFGVDHFLFNGLNSDGSAPDEHAMTFWLFQVVFCATAATIVSGAMAERTNFPAYLFFSFVISAFIYPIYGKWAWGSLFGGSGLVENWAVGEANFIDFAGSTVVHSVGGWCALAGAICLGPRLGRYDSKGKVRMIPGHNLVYGMIGVFILWMGWFGFNGGSTTAVGGSSFASICVTTMVAACAGGIAGMGSSKVAFGKWDLGVTANSILGGLVGITAGCDVVSISSAVIIGAVAGIIMPFSIMFFDKIKVDDPVGATSVHLVCGIWGTLAAGLFAQEAFGATGLFYHGNVDQVLVQLIGIGLAAAWVFPTSLITFKVADLLFGLRVPKEIEEAGLDVEEHGISAYPPAMVFDSQSTPHVAT